MESVFHRYGAVAIAVLLAALACLQPGIDPVFLTLLSVAHAVEPGNHGWIVGATQAGMAVGALLVWRYGSALPRTCMPIAALIALAASVMTTGLGDMTGLVIMRALYGGAMGIVYTQAMSRAAAFRPNGAYGAVFLVQLVLSTVAALILPAIAAAGGGVSALAALALVPLAMLALMAPSVVCRGKVDDLPPAAPNRAGKNAGASAAGLALAVATFFFICATMMIWSFTGALAVAAGIEEEVIGLAVAIGSVAGVLTAIAVLREKPVIPLSLTGLFSALCLVSPMILTPRGEAGPFIFSIVLLNIGSTAIIIRCSGMATVRAHTALFRRFVATTHPLGMIGGPVLGSVLMMTLGEVGLMGGAVAILIAGCAMLLLAAVYDRVMTLHGAMLGSEDRRDPLVA